MNDTKIASKAKAQLASFMGKVFTHFSKPGRRFVEDCIYGIQASGDAKLSSIVRAIDDDIRPIYTEKRLSRNLDDDDIGDSVAAAVLEAGAASVRGDTLLLVDPTEIRKEFAHAMEYVTRVRDARPCAGVHDAPLPPRHLRLARQGVQRADLLRRDARQAANAP